MNNLKKTLLVVEDEPMMRRLLLHIFSEKYNVVLKENGLEAIEWLKTGTSPSVIIADLNMPEIDGYEFMAEVRKYDYYNNVPLIVLSGEQGSDDRVKCLKRGADDFMTKPFNPEELEIRIEKLASLLGDKAGVSRMDGVKVMYKEA
ncbi:response regulator [Luteibaculum oceani]|uniref:Response regulator n=1 Tax=Luteibaculum oceani TaxID=1294296 RepID=A0A5C6UYT1_9FLAO|nr:response regulator [Luteibaculum oceani]TXC78643.1 response regulator [Luteibaculum oceani]